MKLVRTFRFAFDKSEVIEAENLKKMVEAHGDYNLEAHEVATEDGYRLTLHRLVKPEPEVKDIDRVEERLPVFLQHGLVCSSADWLVKGGLSYFLADRGYDVWIGNFRGNIFSRHITLDKMEKVSILYCLQYFTSFLCFL